MKKFVLLYLTGLLIGCGQESQPADSIHQADNTERKVELKSEIDANISMLFNQSGSEDTLRQLLSNISEYAAMSDSTDTVAANYLIKTAGFYQTQGAKTYQVRMYERLIQDFYYTPKTPETMYVCGHLHWELGDNERAKTLMIQLVDDFPESPYAAEAKNLVPEMNKSHEEWQSSIVPL